MIVLKRTFILKGPTENSGRCSELHHPSISLLSRSVLPIWRTCLQMGFTVFLLQFNCSIGKRLHTVQYNLLLGFACQCIILWSCICIILLHYSFPFAPLICLDMVQQCCLVCLFFYLTNPSVLASVCPSCLPDRSCHVAFFF